MITIKFDDKEVKEALNKLSKKLSDLSPVMREIAGIMHDAVEENFEREGRPKWTSLKASTIKERARKGYWPGKILQRRGRLAASISSHYDAHSAAVGTNVKYAAVHQFGGKAGRKHAATIPARPFLVVQDTDIQEIKKTIIEYLAQK